MYTGSVPKASSIPAVVPADQTRRCRRCTMIAWLFFLSRCCTCKYRVMLMSKYCLPRSDRMVGLFSQINDNTDKNSISKKIQNSRQCKSIELPPVQPSTNCDFHNGDSGGKAGQNPVAQSSKPEAGSSQNHTEPHWSLVLSGILTWCFYRPKSF